MLVRGLKAARQTLFKLQSWRDRLPTEAISVPAPRLQHLVRQIHALGERPLFELFRELERGADLHGVPRAICTPGAVRRIHSQRNGGRDLPKMRTVRKKKMTARALVSGVIFKAPVEKTSKAGNAYVTATIRDGKGDAARWWKALVFGDDAMAEVLRLGDGDPLAVAGEFDCQAYKTDAGEDRLSWSIMVDAVLSARAKPKKAKPSQDNPQPFDTKRWEGGPDDGIPF